MKTTLSIILIVFFMMLAWTPNTFAQDYTQWNLPEGAKARLGKGRRSEIAYSPDGTRLAVASSIGVWLYDTETYQEIALLTGHTSGVNSVAFSPDGSTLATGSYDNTIRLWNPNTGTHLRTLTGHTDWVYSVSFSPDGNTIASGSVERSHWKPHTNTTHTGSSVQSGWQHNRIGQLARYPFVERSHWKPHTNTIGTYGFGQ